MKYPEFKNIIETMKEHRYDFEADIKRVQNTANLRKNGEKFPLSKHIEWMVFAQLSNNRPWQVQPGDGIGRTHPSSGLSIFGLRPGGDSAGGNSLFHHQGGLHQCGTPKEYHGRMRGKRAAKNHPENT